MYFFSWDFLKVGLWKLKDFFKEGKIIPFDVWKNRGLSQTLYLQWRAVCNAVCRIKNINWTEVKDDIAFVKVSIED